MTRAALSIVVAALIAAPALPLRAQDAPPVAAAVLDAKVLPLGEAQADRRVGRRWVGEFVETRYADDVKGETVYLVRWRAPDPAGVPFRDLDAAIDQVFDDPGLEHLKGWADGPTTFRAFKFGDDTGAMQCVGFNRDDAANEGTFGVHCATGTTGLDPALAEKFASAVKTGTPPEGPAGSQDVIEPPT